MRQLFILVLLCVSCKPSSDRVVTDADLPPRALAQTSLSAAPSDVRHAVQCLQNASGRVRIAGIIRRQILTSVPTPDRAHRVDTIAVLETPIRTADCQSPATGQVPRELEPRSLVQLLAGGAAILSLVGDTVVVFGEVPARPPSLIRGPMQVRLDSVRVTSNGQRTTIRADNQHR
jgi:hypothetical protein